MKKLLVLVVLVSVYGAGAQTLTDDLGEVSPIVIEIKSAEVQVNPQTMPLAARKMDEDTIVIIAKVQRSDFEGHCTPFLIELKKEGEEWKVSEIKELSRSIQLVNGFISSAEILKDGEILLAGESYGQPAAYPKNFVARYGAKGQVFALSIDADRNWFGKEKGKIQRLRYLTESDRFELVFKPHNSEKLQAATFSRRELVPRHSANEQTELEPVGELVPADSNETKMNEYLLGETRLEILGSDGNLLEIKVSE